MTGSFLEYIKNVHNTIKKEKWAINIKSVSQSTFGHIKCPITYEKVFNLIGNYENVY